MAASHVEKWEENCEVKSSAKTGLRDAGVVTCKRRGVAAVALANACSRSVFTASVGEGLERRVGGGQTPTLLREDSEGRV